MTDPVAFLKAFRLYIKASQRKLKNKESVANDYLKGELGAVQTTLDFIATGIAPKDIRKFMKE